MGKLKQEKAITLVALVITIIILLILAGITINLTVGQRGILTRAQEAGRNYEEAVKKEDEELEKFLEETDNIIKEIHSSNEPKYTMIDGVPVPKGFEHVEGTTKTDGFVIRDNSGTQTNGNEFVWIPCTEDGVDESIKYDRYVFSKDGWEFTQIENGEEITVLAYGPTFNYAEAKPSVELNSIKKYGGFYIGRYEVGIEGGTQDLLGMIDEVNAPSVEWTGWKNGKAIVQANKQVWNYLTKEGAKKVVEEMYSNNNIVESRLCSSYAWDTTLQFIGGDYAVNSAGDNYSGEVNKTGEKSTAVKNIYDLGGNVSEWTTETCKNAYYFCTLRGGNYTGNVIAHPAGSRFYGNATYTGKHMGVRAVLFIRL